MLKITHDVAAEVRRDVDTQHLTTEDVDAVIRTLIDVADDAVIPAAVKDALRTPEAVPDTQGALFDVSALGA